MNEFVSLKTSHDDLVSEVNALRKVKEENENLMNAIEIMDQEKENLKNKLRYTEERLRSFDEQSFEINPDSKRENENLKRELINKEKTIQQLNIDLHEAEESFEKLDQKLQVITVHSL